MLGESGVRWTRNFLMSVISIIIGVRGQTIYIWNHQIVSYYNTTPVVYGGLFDPYSGGGGKWRPFRFRPPSWMTSFPVPQMRSSKMAAGRGRVAIFHRHRNRGRKGRPRSWLTSFPAPPSWNQDGGATSNVWRTLGLPWRRPILRKGWS